MRVLQNMNIKEKTVAGNTNHVYGKVEIPNHISKRVSMIMDYRKAFPHLFPMRQYKPIELTDRQYELARMIAEGRTNAPIAKDLIIVVRSVELQTNLTSRKIRDQLPSNYNIRVHIANFFSGGVFYSESNPLGPK